MNLRHLRVRGFKRFHDLTNRNSRHPSPRRNGGPEWHGEVVADRRRQDRARGHGSGEGWSFGDTYHRKAGEALLAPDQVVELQFAEEVNPAKVRKPPSPQARRHTKTALRADAGRNRRRVKRCAGPVEVARGAPDPFLSGWGPHHRRRVFLRPFNLGITASRWGLISPASDDRHAVVELPPRERRNSPGTPGRSFVSRSAPSRQPRRLRIRATCAAPTPAIQPRVQSIDGMTERVSESMPPLPGVSGPQVPSTGAKARATLTGWKTFLYVFHP